MLQMALILMYVDWLWHINDQRDKVVVAMTSSSNLRCVNTSPRLMDGRSMRLFQYEQMTCQHPNDAMISTFHERCTLLSLSPNTFQKAPHSLPTKVSHGSSFVCTNYGPWFALITTVLKYEMYHDTIAPRNCIGM